jgi:predicted transcriptional regulator
MGAIPEIFKKAALRMSDDIARVCRTLADAPQQTSIMVIALREAAAEIERLRAEVAALRKRS